MPNEPADVLVVVDLNELRPDTHNKSKSNKEKERTKKMAEKANPDLVRALLRQFGRRIIPLGLIKLLFDVCGTFSPFVIKFSALSLRTTSSNSPSRSQFLFVVTTVAYRKSLRLSSAARQNFNAGKAMNVVSTIEQFLRFVHIMCAPVFASLSWFNLLIFPLMFLSQIVTGYADFKVAIDRISEPFLAAEVHDPPQIDTSVNFGIKVFEGEFTWDSALRSLCQCIHCWCVAE
ncbi:hypothetical protein BJ742DRAFT_771987 [Cladochytrium replicatum]|nr:hypothetical protein BJ742DRAFT_771987 [Cladochytrium replicatum]